MSVLEVFTPEFRYYGNPAEKGGPSGIFSGRHESTGDVSGGNIVISADGSIPALQGLLLVIRNVIIGTDVATARKFLFTLLNTYWSTSPIILSTGVTVAGLSDSAVQVIGSNNPVLWMPDRSIGDPSICQMSQTNVDGEKVHLFIQGELWFESALRKHNIGPLIRW